MHTAAEVFGIPQDKITPEKREATKAISVLSMGLVVSA